MFSTKPLAFQHFNNFMPEKPEKIYTHLDGKQFVLRFIDTLPIQYRIGLLSDLPSYEIWLSLERAAETVVRHPEFNLENIFDIAAEAVSKISAIHTNRMPDTVRFYTRIEKLCLKPVGASPDDMIFIALKLSNFHPYNFIKSLYIVSEFKKGGSPIWKEE
ncbi:hypothetical protein FJZ31_19565 [Candidatus Poribacteria bacterium]|nr:hypothetical protein [Candidatus Poribacteria bacterium]